MNSILRARISYNATRRLATRSCVGQPTAGVVKRSYTTPPNPAGSPPPKQSGSNTATYLALGTAAGALAYWYAYGEPKAVDDLGKQAKAHEEEMKRKARDSVEAGKARAGDAKQQAENKYEEVKGAGESRLQSAKDQAQRSIADLEKRGKEAKDGVDAKYEAYKDSAKHSVSNARQSTEDLYNDARGAVDRKAGEARAGAEKRADQAKQGWLSWLGWGKSQVEEGKKEGAAKTAEAAEEVRRKAEKHT